MQQLDKLYRIHLRFRNNLHRKYSFFALIGRRQVGGRRREGFCGQRGQRGLHGEVDEVVRVSEPSSSITPDLGNRRHQKLNSSAKL